MSSVWNIEIENEKSLVAKIAEGNHKAFTSLFKNCYNKVYSYAMKICQSEFVAEEIVQDVFMKIWINKASLPGIENIGGYIFTMTRNQALQALKKIALETHCNAVKNLDWTELDKQTENYINYKDAKMILDKAIATLPSQQKLVYHMCHMEGMKHQEVANQLSISRLTVKVHLRQAVKTVREIVLSNTSFLFFLIVNQLFEK
ncbi:RNA polymerase sigma-70 factor [Mucilaginibacter paludis]|uniref:RNA polymerase, sigma-24 subunit, ECF subfamily n=1 Tax=Mucilaginibacter paludis DSM 18603 TaxID=714943 RepID=H1YBB0_9SPHI|nr:RNA polymerase sigma-70 factor [Mucilaginibacter paludis]EHQ31164.1 RNA polymerase, sigma-24 subunit, ECF subfamily [Mucilaginibacter paludis DSM 18603]